LQSVNDGLAKLLLSAVVREEISWRAVNYVEASKRLWWICPHAN
jgi:hypothetical protein